MKQFISYEGLPINFGGSHSLSRKSGLENYNLTLEFLKRFADKAAPKNIELIIYQSEKKQYSTLKLLPKLSLMFGIPKFDNNGLLHSWIWKLSKSDVGKGFEILKLNNDLPNNLQGPIILSFTWNFHFKDITTNKLLPNQEKIPEIDFRNNNSRIYLRISNKSTISVWFALPFEQLGNYEMEYIEELKSSLPFKPSEKHWRMWKKSEKGNWNPSKIKTKNDG